ncbi:hypothetical protein BDW_06230 [Bdellovibrio bacteriovorus W]|nr:hypothetical protein BDW_06230 [Bdellovibrio bacteriovorus W]
MTCHDCKGSTLVRCCDCEGQGGHQNAIEVKASTVYSENNITISKVKEIPADFGDMTEQLEITHDLVKPTILLDKIFDLTKEEFLRPYIEEIYQHVQNNKAPTTLLENFSLAQGELIYFTLDFAETEGVFVYSTVTESISAQKDPLTSLHLNVKQNLITKFESALANKNYNLCEKTLNELSAANLTSDAKSLKEVLKQHQAQSDIDRRIRIGRWFHRGTYIALSLALWIALCFFINLSLLFLITIIIITAMHCGHKDGYKKVPTNQEIFQGYISYLKLLIIWAAMLGANYYFGILNYEHPADSAFNTRIILETK